MKPTNFLRNPPRLGSGNDEAVRLDCRRIPVRLLVAFLLLASLSSCQTTVVETGEEYRPEDTGTPNSVLDSRLISLEKKVEKYPKRHDLLYQMASVQFQKADYKESAATLEKALALSPDEAKYHVQAGRVYMTMGELDEAEKHFRKAARLLPPDRYSGPSALLGYVLSLKKDYRAAIAAFKDAVAAEPENPEFYYSLGALYDLLGNRSESVRYFKEYLLHGGTRYRKTAVFLLKKAGVQVEELPRPAPSRDASGRPRYDEDFLPSQSQGR